MVEDNSVEKLKQQFLEGKKNLLAEYEKQLDPSKEGEGITKDLIDKMLLPEGCYLVERAKSDLGIIVQDVKPTYKNYGKIILAAEDISEYIGDTVYFKENHVEEIIINNKKYLYFTNLKHSIYYIIEK